VFAQQRIRPFYDPRAIPSPERNLQENIGKFGYLRLSFIHLKEPPSDESAVFVVKGTTAMLQTAKYCEVCVEAGVSRGV